MLWAGVLHASQWWLISHLYLFLAPYCSSTLLYRLTPKGPRSPSWASCFYKAVLSKSYVNFFCSNLFLFYLYMQWWYKIWITYVSQYEQLNLTFLNHESFVLEGFYCVGLCVLDLYGEKSHPILLIEVSHPSATFRLPRRFRVKKIFRDPTLRFCPQFYSVTEYETVRNSGTFVYLILWCLDHIMVTAVLKMQITENLWRTEVRILKFRLEVYNVHQLQKEKFNLEMCNYHNTYEQKAKILQIFENTVSTYKFNTCTMQ